MQYGFWFLKFARNVKNNERLCSDLALFWLEKAVIYFVDVCSTCCVSPTSCHHVAINNWISIIEGWLFDNDSYTNRTFIKSMKYNHVYEIFTSRCAIFYFYWHTLFPSDLKQTTFVKTGKYFILPEFTVLNRNVEYFSITKYGRSNYFQIFKIQTMDRNWKIFWVSSKQAGAFYCYKLWSSVVGCHVQTKRTLHIKIYLWWNIPISWSTIYSQYILQGGYFANGKANIFACVIPGPTVDLIVTNRRDEYILCETGCTKN